MGVAVLLGAGFTTTSSAAPAEPAPAAQSSPTARPVVRYNFDLPGDDGSFPDETGHNHVLRTRTEHSGAASVTRHAGGRALEFPKKCTGGRCPHAMLEAAHAADLDPGTAPIAFGAAVKLARSQTTDGQNVLQKGYSAAGSQYKLQIDGMPGRPSCALVDDVDRTIYLAKSSVSVADKQWHNIECRRNGTAFSILVDGAVAGSTVVPATLAVSNTVPLDVGGKGTGQDNDQFQGSLDDVWVTIG